LAASLEWYVVCWALGVVAPSAEDRWGMEDRFTMFVACCQLDVVSWINPKVA
jgi:hypothetical protein